MTNAAYPSIERRQVAGMNIHYLNYSLDYFLDAQARLGFETIELWAGVPHVWIDHLDFYDADVIRRKIRDHHLTLCCLTPENCLYPYQVAAKEPDHIARSFAYFRNGLRMAAELGSPLMEINSGWGYLNESREEGLKRSAEMLARLAEEAGRLGVTLVMESLRPEESRLVTNLTQTREMLALVNSPHLKPMADLCAVSVAGETLTDWFKAFGSDLIHMHFIDGDPYGHYIWGDGHHHLGREIEVLNRFGYQGCLGQEITDGRYYDDPVRADLRNMRNFERYIRPSKD